MKVKAIILGLMVGLLALNISSAPVEAQPPIPPLPADLLFTASLTAGQGDYPRDIIVRADAGTLEVTPFYIDTEAFEVMPISWSPQGDLLAIYRVMPAIDGTYSYNSSPRQLCILDRAGVLQRCLDDSPPMHYTGSPDLDWQHYYPVAWGPDGQTIYFDTEYPNNESPNGYGRRLIEANVLTGETLRIIYDYPDAYAVTPSPDLNHLAVGFGEEWFLDNPAYIFDLTTEAKLDLPDLMPDLTWLSRGCLPFSPHGSYLTAITKYDLAEYAPNLEAPDDYREGSGSLLLILDTEGAIRHIIGQPEGSPATMWDQECPGWQPDEQAIVFLASGADESRIMRYSLSDQQTTTLYELGGGIGHESYVYSPLIPSPDGTYVALTVSDEPYGDRQVAVLYPDGNIYRIPSPYRFGLYPLWIPPLSNTPPVTNDDSVTTDEDTPVSINVLANDTDAEGDPLTIGQLTQPANGVVVDNGDGTLTYTPNPNFNGIDTFTYQVCDPEPACTIGVVTVTVNPVNDLPIVTVSQSTVTVNAGQTVSNEGTVSDADGDEVLLSASVGMVTNNNDGTWFWSLPTDSSTGSQVVTITADDGQDGVSQVAFDLVVNVPPTPTPTGTGLQGQYFNKKDFTRLVLTRIDATVDFDWGKGSPDPAVQKNSFSVRWTGQVVPLYSETYTFYTVSDDGVRLWVNGQQIVNNWNNHSEREDSGQITLVAGQQYDIRMEYYEDGGEAVARLLWSSPSQAKEVIPQGQLYPPVP